MADSFSERNSPSVGLLISVLVRYPEIASVHYDHKDQSLRFSLLLAQPLEKDDASSLRSRIDSSLEAYFHLEHRRPVINELSLRTYEDITVVELKRDVASITQEEISMVTEIVKDSFSGELVVERGDSFGDDDPALQEEMIEEMLDDLRQSKQQRNLVAFREEGRVLVYNK